MQLVCPQKKHEQLVQEQKELAASRDDRQQLTQEFRRRSEKMSQALEEDQRLYEGKIEAEKVWILIVVFVFCNLEHLPMFIN